MWNEGDCGRSVNQYHKRPSQTKKGQRRQSRNGATKRTAEESGRAPSSERLILQDNKAGALGHRYQESREGQQQGKNGHWKGVAAAEHWRGIRLTHSRVLAKQLTLKDRHKKYEKREIGIVVVTAASMAQITWDLGGSGSTLQTEDDEDKERTRKRRPVNKKTTRGEGSAERVQGDEGSGLTACVCGCTHMAKPHVALGGRQVHIYGEAAFFFPFDSPGIKITAWKCWYITITQLIIKHIILFPTIESQHFAIPTQYDRRCGLHFLHRGPSW